ncbi:MAG: lasso peptide biosynthesis B2 protein [Anderseniella sp.]|jgi:hypothetical protein|nr:lasso peptide biosynthesis B2 protein [Anderseniella sp.]
MLVRLVFLLPAVGASLRLLGFKRTRYLLERFAPPPVQKRLDETSPSENASRIARLVGIAGYHGPYRATCLRQSLALWLLLRRRGIPAELRIGVRKETGDFDAHAWVDHEGVALNDRSDVSSRFPAFPGL